MTDINRSPILFLGTKQDEAYLPHLKAIDPSYPMLASCAPVNTIYEVVSACKKRNITKVATSNPTLLQRLVISSGNGTVSKISTSEESIDNYAGSYFKQQGIEFVILHPLQQLFSVSYGRFLAKRFLSKLSYPTRWMKFPAFSHTILNATNIENWYSHFGNAKFISVDIETAMNPLRITCIGYCGVWVSPSGALTMHSVVLPIDDMFAVSWMRKFNQLPAAKIFQNGKYDNAYLTAWNASVHNWVWDTANLFHSYYSELPKNLGFPQAYCVREGAYWKDLARTSDREQYYLYNAMDTYGTACSALTLLNEMPQWAIDNYVNEFPLNFPCHLSEMTGLRRDKEVISRAQDESAAEIATLQHKLNTMVGCEFNTASSPQKKKLLIALGCKDIAEKSADAKSLTKAAYRHPLNARICNMILKIQKLRKLHSTYLTEEKDFNGRILYALNPHGTDTSRLASRTHHFWVGYNIQNIPRGKTVKQTMIADDGFMLFEDDLEQAESRDTAYIAGEENLIAAVTGPWDFHSKNAASFFGVPYNEIYDSAAKKTLNSDLRDVAKRVNHGANYVMGPAVMAETMGEEAVYKAALLLKLPRAWSATDITSYLLSRFHITYPGLERTYYSGIIAEVARTSRITSKAKHDAKYQASTNGLTRYCFKDPVKNKRDKNAYAAHPPQSLNAMTLNKAYMTVFYDIALNPEYSKHFKLCAQIHDSILGQFRIGYEFLGHKVKEIMEIPVTIEGYDGKVRTFTVPAALKAGKDVKGAASWAGI
jgi:hypothetical protein